MAKKKVNLIRPLEKTLIERYRAIQEIGTDVEIPYEVTCVFGGEGRELSVVGSHVCLGEDYVDITKARQAISWMATQLGGKIIWD